VTARLARTRAQRALIRYGSSTSAAGGRTDCGPGSAGLAAAIAESAGEPSGPAPAPAALLAITLVLGALAGAPAAIAADDPDQIGDAQLSPVRLTDYDYSLAITESAINKLFERVAQLDASRPGLDRKIKQLKVQVIDKAVNIAGSVQVPVLGSVKFDMLGDLRLEKPNQFAYQFRRYVLTKETLLADIPLALGKSVLLAIFGVFARNQRITEYLELSTNLMVDIPFTPASWKKVYFTLKPKALPVINNMDTLFLGKEGQHVVLQGRLRR
jgi:hypothetical protein